ncbi:SlyX protein [Pseudoalteromonas ulvae UL12]|uniref:Protein SlyX homolog n=1 Tax=Pseudoalteromonas ulvae TaxID=107327 RepID=A0A244CM78_PSEDV|nr:SlyX family protein [Pseudoalteromonas ulvae]MBE0364847.1 SlyX protein [Pseudoalteromonas ulvae UL12]OUL56073.1 SlyX protein [Pseudoalteromonas ulvae]
MSDLETRIYELEAKVAFQDETIDILNDEIREHQKIIAIIQRQTQLLAEKIKEVQNSPNSDGPLVEPPPPHY